jgi:hypothetical protein
LAASHNCWTFYESNPTTLTIALLTASEASWIKKNNGYSCECKILSKEVSVIVQVIKEIKTKYNRLPAWLHPSVSPISVRLQSLQIK